MVRYRSPEDAIAYIMQPEDGLYRHPFVAQRVVGSQDLEGGMQVVCYLCQQEESLHQVFEAVGEADVSDMAKYLELFELEE